MNEHTLIQPSARQLAFQERQFGAFIHFGLATWYDGPDTAVFPRTLRAPYAFNMDLWGAMTAQPAVAVFDPRQLDAAQWMAAAQAVGARHVVLTAKHHNGFCLWPTATTEYCVRNSPWRDGHGDVLREFVDAARRAGLGVGIYLSAGDVHHGCFSTPEPQGERRVIGDIDEYLPVFEVQCREVFSDYGELCEIWLDGALDPFGPDVRRPDGSQVGTAYWDRLIALTRALQPNAVIMGGTQPDVRWPGNEDGLAPYPLWNVVRPGEEAANYLPAGVTGWLAPEADVFTRPTWFWTAGSDEALCSLDRLRDIYARSIGHGANLLINMTPDRRGLIPEAEVRRLAALGDDIRRRFGAPCAETAGEMALREDMRLELAWDHPASVVSVILEEDLRYGQRVARYQIEVLEHGAWRMLAAGQTIGRRRIACFPPATTRHMRLRILESAEAPIIRRFAVFC